MLELKMLFINLGDTDAQIGVSFCKLVPTDEQIEVGWIERNGSQTFDLKMEHDFYTM